jgi:glutaredoxin
VIVLYSRDRCPKCDEAKAVLQSADIEFLEVNISKDAALEAEYGSLVPVVEADGQIVFEAGMKPADLPSLLSG